MSDASGNGDRKEWERRVFLKAAEASGPLGKAGLRDRIEDQRVMSDSVREWIIAVVAAITVGSIVGTIVWLCAILKEAR